MSLFGFIPADITQAFALAVPARRHTMDWLTAELANSAGVETWEAREALLASLVAGSEARLEDGAEVRVLVRDAAQRLGVPPPALVPLTVN